MTAVGELVAHYRITGIVGRGQMATVYRAHDERLNRDVALKLLAPESSMDFILRARFEREYRMTAQLQHENIVPVFDAGAWADQLYIAMQLVDGPNLATVINNEGPLGLARAISITRQVASALDEAHGHRVLHRDVKPANILLTRPQVGGPEHAYLADFGLTLGMEGTHLTKSGGFIGTLAYSSPEQLTSRDIDAHADQYGLACTTFMMLAGTPPFVRDNELALINAHMFDKPPNVADFRDDVPRAVGAVIARGMAKKPADRYVSAGAFAQALARAAGQGAGTRMRRTLVAAAAVAALAVATVGVAVVLGMLNGTSPNPTPSALVSPSLPVAVGQPTPTASTLPTGTLAPTALPSEPPRTPRPSRTVAPATPAPTPAPLPEQAVADGAWSVSNSPRDVTGSPYVALGEHGRRYEATARCESEDSCRMTAVTFDSATGNRLGRVTFRWRGSDYFFRGSASWYARRGGTTCETESGELIADAYTTSEEVQLEPGGHQNGRVVSLSGTKTISGTPTAAGTAAGCAPYSMTFAVDMTWSP